MSADSTASAFECRALSAAHASALAALFERAESGCYCEWWHFDGDKNAWLARLAEAPQTNRARLAERACAPGPSGVVAVRPEGDVIGWMKLTPALELGKLYAQRPYRSLAVLSERREATMTVGCFLVDPAWRRRGVAAALLARGLELARAAGAVAVEAFPRRAETLRDEEVWTGPYELLARNGFQIVHDLVQYPVLRRML